MRFDVGGISEPHPDVVGPQAKVVEDGTAGAADLVGINVMGGQVRLERTNVGVAAVSEVREHNDNKPQLATVAKAIFSPQPKMLFARIPGTSIDPASGSVGCVGTESDDTVHVCVGSVGGEQMECVGHRDR